jgi:CheY-like chemotaxis protein/anti-sigma regulatory factor (Ser/Thr protein kinase)
VESEVEAARPEAESRALRLVLAAKPDLPWIDGDAGRLQQVVRNLLSNALKFTPAGGEVTVGVNASDGTARITVRDTGRGIDRAFLPHVFDRFRQADSSMTRAHDGLGVGLAIARHIVELHGGRISAKSDGPGTGATLTVTLPILERHETTRPGDWSDDAADTTLPDLNGVRVLVVENETGTRELVATVLAGCGAEVTGAASADQALAEIPRVHPDVLVSDLAMPGVDGLELIRRVRSLSPDRGGKTPAAALTAYARRTDAERALAAGFEAHVVKPFEPAHLARVVADLAGLARPGS